MKTKFALALSAVGFLAFAHRAARAEEPPASPPKPAAPAVLPFTPPKAEFASWRQGKPPVKLIRREEGFCALTSVTGHFQGDGEQVGVYVGPDGYWYLGGRSKQSDVAAECIVVRLPIAPAVPAEENAVHVLGASYSFGSQFADVTERVKELLRDDNAFQANPAALLVDPHPYMNKCLVIFCEVRGKSAIFSVGESENVSRELMLANAQPLAAPAALDAPTTPKGSGKPDQPAPKPSDEEPASALVSPANSGAGHYVEVIRGGKTIKADLRQARRDSAHDLKLQPGDASRFPEAVW